MNISEAKDYIKHSIQIYLKKDEFGDYKIPVVRQRPIFLLGAPGIGKTAIMEQIAQEMGIALVSYSMTHHTRQSALGLPFIKQKEYGGKTYDVSEYTMSEIIASVYDTMEESGVKEGILFLDEINCVSETLAPSMLQFLQYKVFGKHKVPEGWVIVTAGNPPEYNKSVREFDVVTMDRLKVLEVEADYKTWKIYAKEKGVHSAILNFLDIKRDYFYHMETTGAGRSYVTARGWEDLSQIITLYEEDGIQADETLFAQYLQNEKIVKEFGAYYDLYNKYKKDYQVDALLSGEITTDMIEKARKASFDERLSLMGMLLDKVLQEMKDIMETSAYLTELMQPLKAVKGANKVYEMLETQEQAREQIINNLEKANSLSMEDKKKHKRILMFLRMTRKQLIEDASGIDVTDNEKVFIFVKELFDHQVASMKENVAKTSERLHHLFAFTSKAFKEGNEMLVLVTELTVNKYSSRYIGTYGCEDYHHYNKLLMVSERQQDLKEEIKDLLL
ncbi:MAG: ATP-binding protein [Lachnospiraceae bacterium]